MKKVFSTKDCETPVTFVLDEIAYFEMFDFSVEVHLKHGVDYTIECEDENDAKKVYNGLIKAFEGEANSNN